MAGLSVEYYRYYDPVTRGLDFQGLLSVIVTLNNFVLLNGC